MLSTRTKASPVDRVLRGCIEDDNGCWLWQGARNTKGYFRIHIGWSPDGRRIEDQGYRVTYEYFRSEIPDGLVMDHLCRVRHCANPWHLEPVTYRENTLRGDATRNGEYNRNKTHCPSGHPYSPENTHRPARNPNERVCRICHREARRRSDAKRRAKETA